ncbi:MAG: DnaJ domain-containing protein [Deltaproteobacteria bacterium]|nr:DnaJ domain-containing protein [Deltaproteobacteria bacterium]
MAPGLDCFQVLGLERHWQVTDEALAEAFRRESRKCHPDRFFNATPEEKRRAMSRTTDVTEAYRTLKDLLGRAIYLIESAGKSIEDRDARAGAEGWLLEVVEVREQVAELRARGPGAAGEFDRLFSVMQEKVAAVEQEIKGLFAAVDDHESPAAAAGALAVVAEALATLVGKHRYYSRTIDEIRRARAALGA